MNSDVTEKPFLSFDRALKAAFIFLVIYVLILIILGNKTSQSMFFSDFSAPIIEITVALSLFYAVKRSAVQGRRVQIAWTFIAVAALSYFLGDTIWAILELGLNQQPFPSIADVFYLSFYPLFALGIYYLPRSSLKRSEEFKLIIDMAIIIITVGLIFWILLIIPAFNANNDFLGSIISSAYVIGDLLLLFALIRLMFNSFKSIYRGPLALIGLGIFAQIVTDSIYLFQSIQGTYVSGGLLDVGWVLSFVLVGLAAILQINAVAYGYRPFAKLGSRIGKFSFPSYLPLVWLIITYVLLIWANESLFISNSIIVEITGGVLILLVLIRQAITLNENKKLYQAAEKEINERKKVEKTLISSKRHFKNIFDNSPIGIFHSSPEGKFYEVNKALSNMLRYESPDELVSTVNKGNIYDLYVDGESRSHFIEESRQDPSWHFHENEFYRKDGSIMASELSFRMAENPDGSKYLEGFISDITDRKQAENDIKASLKEKELLLKEIHHRVKNNLQIISSLLDLQEAFVEQKEAINVLRESQNRVKSMATIHEMLYQSTDLIHIDFSNYIYTMVSDLFHAYGIDYNKIKYVTNIEQVFLNIETAIPCGLIISELVSNSLKYAFPSGRSGKISIDLIKRQGEFELIISDNGVGFPRELNYKDVKTSLGLRLVNMLTGQLEGSIELDRSQGTLFTIKFKELEYKKRF